MGDRILLNCSSEFQQKYLLFLNKSEINYIYTLGKNSGGGENPPVGKMRLKHRYRKIYRTESFMDETIRTVGALPGPVEKALQIKRVLLLLSCNYYSFAW